MKELVRALVNYFGTRKLIGFLLAVLRDEGLIDTPLYGHLARAYKAKRHLEEWEISRKNGKEEEYDE